MFVFFTQTQTHIKDGAKAIVLQYNGNSFCLAVMSASKKLDNKKMKKLLNAKSLSFAEQSDVFRLSGAVTGAVPPLGSLFTTPIQTYMDTSLQDLEWIDFNCGLRTDSVKMTRKDYELVEKPIISQFTA